MNMIALLALLVVAVMTGVSDKFGVESRPGFAGSVDVNSHLD
jgi:hypothetical protein